MDGSIDVLGCADGPEAVDIVEGEFGPADDEQSEEDVSQTDHISIRI